ncbi:hypothetical protein GJ496_000533, partial [Pomphorhynchus laevis]
SLITVVDRIDTASFADYKFNILAVFKSKHKSLPPYSLFDHDHIMRSQWIRQNSNLSMCKRCSTLSINSTSYLLFTTAKQKINRNIITGRSDVNSKADVLLLRRSTSQLISWSDEVYNKIKKFRIMELMGYCKKYGKV